MANGASVYRFAACTNKHGHIKIVFVREISGNTYDKQVVGQIPWNSVNKVEFARSGLQTYSSVTFVHIGRAVHYQNI